MTSTATQTNPSLQATLAICAGGAARRRRRRRTGLVAASLAGFLTSTLDALREYGSSIGGTGARA